jgi:hypothetical protein
VHPALFSGWGLKRWSYGSSDSSNGIKAMEVHCWFKINWQVIAHKRMLPKIEVGYVRHFAQHSKSPTVLLCED